MARILVRGIDDQLKELLMRRALRHGRSMEDEVRDILRDAVKAGDNCRGGLGTEIASLFQQIGLKDHERFMELSWPMDPAWSSLDNDCGPALSSPAAPRT